LPQMVHRLATGELNGLCHVVDYAPQPSSVQPDIQEE